MSEEELVRRLHQYARAYSAYNRSEGGVEETRRLERLEDEFVANRCRTNELLRSSAYRFAEIGDLFESPNLAQSPELAADLKRWSREITEQVEKTLDNA